MCSVSQAEAIMIAGEGKRGIANSTYYVGVDLGVALGAIIAGIAFDNLGPKYFYPLLMLCPIMCILVYFIFRKKLQSEKQ